jgi:4-aminobutyrate aminotransferase-like enzyme
VHRNVIKLAPPLTITDDDVDMICEKIEGCVSKQ